jgi:tetratricopeptide (TPR) repeat protein
MFFLGILLAAASGLPAFAVAPADSTELDRALAQVDRMRADGQFEQALTTLQTLRDQHGDQVEILWRVSFTQVDRGKAAGAKDVAQPFYKEAVAFADTALAVDSTSAHAHLAKAVAEGRLALDAGTKERVRRSRKIKQHADRAIELDPKLPGAFHVRGRWNREVSDLNFFERTVVKAVYGGLPESSFEQAVEDFKTAISLEDVRFHHLELAKTYLKMDQEADAREQLQIVLDLPKKELFGDRYEEEARALLKELE